MSGIAGMVSTASPDRELVRRMCDLIVHRGPDGQGFHFDPHAALGHEPAGLARLPAAVVRDDPC